MSARWAAAAAVLVLAAVVVVLIPVTHPIQCWYVKPSNTGLIFGHVGRNCAPGSADYHSTLRVLVAAVGLLFALAIVGRADRITLGKPSAPSDQSSLGFSEASAMTETPGQDEPRIQPSTVPDWYVSVSQVAPETRTYLGTLHRGDSQRHYSRDGEGTWRSVHDNDAADAKVNDLLEWAQAAAIAQQTSTLRARSEDHGPEVIPDAAA